MSIEHNIERLLEEQIKANEYLEKMVKRIEKLTGETGDDKPKEKPALDLMTRDAIVNELVRDYIYSRSALKGKHEHKLRDMLAAKRSGTTLKEQTPEEVLEDEEVPTDDETPEEAKKIMAEEVAKPEVVVEAEEVEEEAEEEEELTFADIQKAVKASVAARGRAETIEIVKRYGNSSRDVKPEDYTELMAELEGLI